VVGEPAADERPDAGGDRCPRRPRADRTPTARFGKVRGDEGKTSWNEECCPCALNTAGNDQLIDVRRSAAPRRGDAEENRAADEHDAPSPSIAEPAADEEQ